MEVLVPDFKGNWEALDVVLAARPDILNHNTETVPRLYRTVRPGARFERSLELLSRSKRAGLLTKSGIMVGLGEEWDEVLDTMRQIREAGTDVLTVGQYLRPSAEHLPLVRYYTPDEFAEIREPSPAASATVTWSRGPSCDRRITPRSRCLAPQPRRLATKKHRGRRAGRSPRNVRGKRTAPRVSGGTCP